MTSSDESKGRAGGEPEADRKQPTPAVDFTEPGEPSAEDTEDFSEVDLDPLPPVRTRPYDPARDRELKRGEIATKLIWILGFVFVATYVITLIGMFVAWGKGTAPDPIKLVELLRALMEPMLTAMTGLVGAVLGFYFGTKSRED